MSLKNIPISKSSKIRVGITIGDPSGIGPAITAKALKKLGGCADFVVIGDRWVFDRASSIEYPASSIKFIDLASVSRKNFSVGKPRAEYGRASVEYLDCALDLLEAKAIDCLVTCPVSKEAINLSGINFSGHTEYLAKKAGARRVLMLLLNNQLKISLVSRHIPLKAVTKNITAASFYETARLTCEALKKLFAIKAPRLVVCGLNPHASDNGVIGNEEKKIILPQVAKLRKKGVLIEGPWSADVAIYKAVRGRYDAVIAMYHDQALIPLKLSDAGRSGVNLTYGLGFVRTSPLHGVAFDIAAKPRLADPSSLIAAIKLAIQCTQNLKNA